MQCKNCKKPLEGAIVVRSQDMAITCKECDGVNIVEAYSAGNWIKYKVSRVEGGKPVKQVDLGDLSEGKKEEKSGDKTGKDKKTDK